MFSNSVLLQFYSTIDTFTVSERKNTRDRKIIFFIIYLNSIENKLLFKKLKIYNDR